MLVHLDPNLPMELQAMNVLKEDIVHREQLQKFLVVLVNLMLYCMLLVAQIALIAGQVTIVQELHHLDLLINVQRLITAQQERLPLHCNQSQESMLQLSNLNL